MSKQLEYYANQEDALLAQARAAGVFSTPTGKGGARERLIAEFLSNHLPGRLTVERGEVIDSAGGSSGEVELIFVDHESGALRVAGESLVAVEAAVGCVEVKTSLAGKELENAFRKIAQIKSLTRTEHHGIYGGNSESDPRIEIPPRSTDAFLVAYKAPRWPTILGRVAANPDWYRHDYMRFGPELICVLGGGVAIKNDQHIHMMRGGDVENREVVFFGDRPGIENLTGHVKEYLSRYGNLTYELDAYLR